MFVWWTDYVCYTWGAYIIFYGIVRIWILIINLCSKYARPFTLFIDIWLIEMNKVCFVITYVVVWGFGNMMFHLLLVDTGVRAAMHGWWNAVVFESQERIWVADGIPVEAGEKLNQVRLVAFITKCWILQLAFLGNNLFNKVAASIIPEFCCYTVWHSHAT